MEDDNTVALKERVRSLRKDKHVHLVVVLLHGGQGSSDGEINEDDLLAQKMSEWEGVIGADFIIGGHTHCIYGPGVGKKSPEEIYGPGEEPEEIS